MNEWKNENDGECEINIKWGGRGSKRDEKKIGELLCDKKRTHQQQLNRVSQSVVHTPNSTQLNKKGKKKKQKLKFNVS